MKIVDNMSADKAMESIDELCKITEATVKNHLLTFSPDKIFASSSNPKVRTFGAAFARFLPGPFEYSISPKYLPLVIDRVVTALITYSQQEGIPFAEIQERAARAERAVQGLVFARDEYYRLHPELSPQNPVVLDTVTGKPVEQDRDFVQAISHLSQGREALRQRAEAIRRRIIGFGNHPVLLQFAAVMAQK